MSMKTKRNNQWNVLIVLGMIVLTVCIVIFNTDLNTMVHTILALDVRWLFVAFLLWFGSAVLEAAILQIFLKKQGCPIRLPYAIHVYLVGAFYSAITPGSSGGQPAQIYCLSKQRVPVGVSSSAITIRFVLSQAAIVVLTLILWMCNTRLINTQLSGCRWLIIIGWLIHLAGVVLILMATFCRTFLQRTADKLIRLGRKLRILRDPEAATNQLNEWIDGYQRSVQAASHHPRLMLLLTLMSVISLLMTMAIVICIYEAFGLHGIKWSEILTIAYMLYLSASYNPLPGASGAQEGGFLLFYKGIFPPGQIGLAMLVWRFFTYYLHLIAGAVAIMIHSIRRPKVASNIHVE